MKKFLSILFLLISLSTVGLAQSQCVDVEEIDGSPKAPCIRELKVTNGTLNCPTVNRCVLTISGGGGGSPGGSAGQIQWNDSGSFGGTSGLTATATTVTIVNGVSATFSNTSTLISATNSNNNASVQIGIWQGDRSAPASNDEAYHTFRLSNDGGTQVEVARMTWAIPTVTAGAVNGRIDWSVMTGNTLAKELQLSGGDLSPSTSDGLALGTASLMWADLFLDAGGVVRFGTNGFRYLNNTGPIFDDSNTGYALTFNVQSLTDNRTVTFPDTALTVAGINVANAWADGVKQTFNPDATNAGINVGSVAGDPSAPANADIWYDSTANKFRCRENGATVNCIGSGSGGITVGTTTVTSGTATRLFYETAGNVVGQVSGVTSDGTNVTAGSGNLRATSPQITTGINDANGNTMLAFSPTGSATQYLTIANNTATNAVSLTANAPTQGASAQAGTPFNLTASAAVAGASVAGAAAGGSVTITAGAAARLTSGNANGGDILLQMGAGIGTGVRGALQIGGTTTSFPALTVGTTAAARAIYVVDASAPTTTVGGIGTGYLYLAASPTTVESSPVAAMLQSSGGVMALASGFSMEWSNSTNAAGTRDTYLMRAGVGNLRFGKADAASPVAQTLSVQNVVAGTSNTAGVNWTFNASRGTGTGAGGDIIFQTAPAGSSGTTQNTLAAAFTVKGDGAVQLKSVTFANLPTVANGYLIYCSDCTIASPCASGGSGAVAKGINGAWVCN